MTGDAFLTEPAGGVGRAMQAGARTPLLDQEFDSGTLYALRAAVQAHASQAGLSEDRVGEVVLAVHELAANAIAHGAGHGRLRMWDLAGALNCEIVDGGPAGAGATPSPAGAGAASSPASAGVAPSLAGAGAGSSPAKAGGPPAVVDPWPAVNGHGLWLVRQVADQLDLRSGLRGTRAMVTFALPLPEDH
jgi:two-component sensor histidine kinase